MLWIKYAGEFWSVTIDGVGLLVTRSYRNAWLCKQGATTQQLRAHLGCDYI